MAKTRESLGDGDASDQKNASASASASVPPPQILYTPSVDQAFSEQSLFVAAGAGKKSRLPRNNLAIQTVLQLYELWSKIQGGGKERPFHIFDLTPLLIALHWGGVSARNRLGALGVETKTEQQKGSLPEYVFPGE